MSRLDEKTIDVALKLVKQHRAYIVGTQPHLPQSCETIDSVDRQGNMLTVTPLDAKLKFMVKFDRFELQQAGTIFVYCGNEKVLSLSPGRITDDFKKLRQKAFEELARTR